MLHGQYRLIDDAYTGPLDYQDVGDVTAPGVVSDDIAVLRGSSLYLEPGLLPDGYALTSANTQGSDSEHVLNLIFMGSGDPITVSRIRRASWPRDIILPTSDSLSIFEKVTVGGISGILYFPEPGSNLGSDITALSFATNGIETSVHGDNLDPAIAAKIALSLVCGACADTNTILRQPIQLSDASVSPPPGNLTEDLVAGQSTANDPTILSHQGFLGDPDDHRVIAGPQATIVRINSWWDHPPAEEWPLDLSPINAPLDAPVNYASWPRRGRTRIYATAEDYSITTNCTGRYIRLKDARGNQLGKLLYVHLRPDTQIPVNQSWVSNTGDFWTIVNLGQIALSQPNCNWTGPSLHQGQDRNAPYILHNFTLPPVGQNIDPTNNPATNWLNRVTFPDNDGDGYTDGYEVQIGENPAVYCPIMRADVDNDELVSILDLSAVGGKFGQSIPPAPARFDQDGDALISVLDLSAMASQFGKPISLCAN